MKKILLYILSITMMAFAFTGCDKEEVSVFNSDSNIYFAWADKIYQTYTTMFDSVGVTFAYSPLSVTDTVFKIPVSVQGLTASYDRNFTVRVTEGTTAIKGVHYEMPETTVIYADSIEGVIPVLFHRTPDMKTDTFMLVLELLPDANFKTNMKELEESNGKKFSYTTLTIAINDLLAKPAAWSDGYFGTYSEKKLLLLNQVTGMPLNALNNYDYFSFWQYWATFMQRWLNEQKADGNTIYEADDVTPMAMNSSMG